MPQAYEWSKLSHLQVGRYAEYFVKMQFVLLGYEVYSSEVDDRGIDFVRGDGKPCLNAHDAALRSPATRVSLDEVERVIERALGQGGSINHQK